MKIEKIYFDMDGVLADFDRGVNELCHFDHGERSNRDKEKEDAMWRAVSKVDHFYDRLPLINGALEMFKVISNAFPDLCEILSAAPKEKRGIVTAKEDKINWVKRILGQDIPVNIVTRAEKAEYAKGKGYVLIDDLKKNIEEWDENGSGILFENADEVILKLKELTLK